MISVFSMPLPYIIYFNKYYHFHFALKALPIITVHMFYALFNVGGALVRLFMRRSKYPHVAKAARKICDFAFLSQHVIVYPSDFLAYLKAFRCF